MSSLPEPATLAPAAARSLIQDIRVRLRPQLLDELSRLYSSDDGGVMSRAAILATEIRLQKLDDYLVSLLPAVRREGAPLGWEALRPAFRHIQRGSVSVEAEVEMAFSPENHECVHGPSTLVAVGGLARRLLAAGERLAAIERVTYATPVRHRLRLSVWDSAEAEPPAGEAALSGRLRTSLGRALEFTGVAVPERPLLIQRDYNALSLALVAGKQLVFGPERTSLTIDLSEAGLTASRRAVRHRPALCASLLLDLVPIAILNWKRRRPMVACGYRDVPLPATPAAAFVPGTRLELRYRKDRSHPSTRSGLWIGYYEFRYVPRQTDWSTMVMAEADDIGLLLRKLHA